MKAKHLPRAPITEALLDLRVTLPSTTTIATLEALHQRVQPEYPTKKKRFKVDASINLGEQAVTVQKNETHLGFFFWSADERQAVQARLDGFSFSRLAPYETWETLRNEAERLWGMYRDVAAPTRVTRVALRYINKMDLPRPFQFEDYLKTLPVLGETCPQTLSGLFMRVAAPVDGATVVISEAIDEQGATPSSVPLILDIDVFTNVDLDTSDESACRAVLEELHDLKNRVFFGSITERAVELFQ